MRKTAASRDLFAEDAPKRAAAKPSKRQAQGRAASRYGEDYTAADIEVLEGLEPVRRRPGMYIGGTDEKAMHHLFAEVLDNAMDEAVAGHADHIGVAFEDDGFLTVTDNGRGIPVDPHPKFKKKSALEIIMTTLHAGGKFNSKVYETSGGLHGVGVSVANALSETMEVEVARGQKLYRQSYTRGVPDGPVKCLGPIKNRRGTRVRFKPDPKIFGKGAAFKPSRLFRMARSKAYLFRGVEIRWSCAKALLVGDSETPESAVFHFPGGLKDFLASRIEGQETVTKDVFSGRIEKTEGSASIEWAIAWIASEDGFLSSYCNTVPTPDGGTHEAGLRAALTKGLRGYGELTGHKRVAQVTADDALGTAAAMLSVFIREPEFQGQTKDRLSSPEAAFIVESGSAGGSAKQARDRATQAVLPLRGKILNVASASSNKLADNQLLSDLIQALGCGTGARYREEDLRYEKVVVMTDADVDGAHIASLLITFFYREMRGLIDGGHLYLAVPPLYRLSQGAKTFYARNDAHKDELMRKEFNGKGKVEVSRFKGLGEMLPKQLKETTMDPKARLLLKVEIADDDKGTAKRVDQLMGNKPEARFRFIQERAEFAKPDVLDI
jgi:DNA gyrase/topoisomerase IV subunit B